MCAIFLYQTHAKECMEFKILIKQDEDGVFVSKIPQLPGCISQGDTREDAITNISDAVLGYMDSLKKHGESIPVPIDEETIQVPV